MNTPLFPFLQDPPAEADAGEQAATEAPAEETPTEETAAVVDEAVDQAMEDPVGFLQQAHEAFMAYLPDLVAGLAILIIGWMVGTRIAKAMGKLINRSGKLEPALERFLVQMIKSLLHVMVVIAAIGKLGIEMASFIAVLGAVGFAVGFAMQGSLSNFAAGVMILFYKPFKEGDLVEINGQFGEVVEIGLFATIINTPQNRKVIIGNSGVIGAVIVNTSANGKLRVDMTFGISYADDVDKAIGILEGILKEDARTITESGFESNVAVVGHGASSIDLVCRPFVTVDDYWDVWFDTHRKVKYAFDEAGVSIPFPQRDVHLYQQSA